MKSTLKIAYTSGVENESVVRIVVPISVMREYEPEDVRDQHIKDFIHPPLSLEPSTFFKIKSAHSDTDDTGVFVTTIGAIYPEDELSAFRNGVLNRIVPTNTIDLLNGLKERVITRHRTMEPGEDAYNKINSFFDELEVMYNDRVSAMTDQE